MKTKSILNAVKKAGLTATKRPDSNWYLIEGAKYYCEFCDQNGEAVCASATRNNEQRDSMTDYYPQIWLKTVGAIVKYSAAMPEMSQEEKDYEQAVEVKSYYYEVAEEIYSGVEH